MILHIDMDAFFAAVEQLDNPELAGVPVIIGGRSNRGVVSTASYEARKYGVHSAMPIFQAKARCPHGVFIPPRMGRYKEISRRVMGILRTFSPLVEPVSIDEAYLDVAGCGRLHGSPGKIAAAIKGKIWEEVQLTASVGIAPVKFLAKIASDLDKPGGITLITRQEAGAFARKLPIGKVPGVGKAGLVRMEQLNIRTLGDVSRYSEAQLTRWLGKFGGRLLALSHCIDESKVTPLSKVKSISGEQTLRENTADRELLLASLLAHAEEVGEALRRSKVRARTIQIKVKDEDFRQITRSVTIGEPTASSETIYREAAKLFSQCRIAKKIRLIGVGASMLVPEGRASQMSLFGGGKKGESASWDKVDRAIDSITGKFGGGAVTKATLAGKPGKKQAGD